MDSKGSGRAEIEGLNRHFPLWLAAILAAAGAAYIDLAAEDPIFQRAEDYFAEAAREMSALSQHITPILYGKPFFDKPILSYWAIQGSFALLGPTHFAARLPSILAGLATIVLTACAAARVWSRRESLMAAAVLSTSYIFFYFATLAMSDIWLTLFCASAGALLFAGSQNPDQRMRDWNLAAIFCGLAVLTKGPVGVVLPAGALLLYLLIRRDVRQIRLRHLVAGLAILAAVGAPWYALLWKEQGAAALRAFFLVENFKRFAGLAYDTHRPFGYIPLSLLMDFLPWSIFLPVALAQSVRKWRRDWDSRESRGELFLWCYIATVVGFFWMARTQMDYYVLPAIPACAVLTGIYLNRAAREDSRFFRLAAWISTLGWCVAGAALFCAAMAATSDWTAASPRFVLGQLRPFWPLALWIFFGGAAAAVLTRRKNYTALLGLAFLGFCGGAAIGLHEAIPFYLRAFPVPTLASEMLHGGEPAALSQDLEHWRGELSFETRRVPALARTPRELNDFLSAPGPHLAIFTDAWEAKLPPRTAGQGLILYRIPILRQGVTLKDLLDPKVMAQTTDQITVIYFPGAISPVDAKRFPQRSSSVAVPATAAQRSQPPRSGL